MFSKELIDFVESSCDHDCCNCNYNYCPKDTIKNIIDNYNGTIKRIR